MRFPLLLLVLLPGCMDALAADVGGSAIQVGARVGDPAIYPPATSAEWVEVFSQNFTAAQTHLPTCNNANNCVMQCYAESDCDWACVDGSGVTIAVTQGTSPTCEDGPWGWALTDVTDAKAPRLTTPPFASVWASPHTVLFGGYSSTRTGAIQYFMGNEAATGGLEVRGEGATFRCLWSNSTAVPTSISVNSTAGPDRSGLNMWACMKDSTGANSTYTSRGPTNTTTNTAWDYDPGLATGASFYMGRRATAGLPQRGPMQSVTLYAQSFTEAQLQAFEQQMAGVSQFEDGSPNNNLLFVVDGSTAWPVGAVRVDQYGLYIEENNAAGTVGGAGGNWATNAIDASSWTDVGTPTITTNTQSGPFAMYNGGAEADLMEDNDGAAFEGKAATVDCGDTITGKLTVSCYVRSGTTGTTTTDMRLSIVSNGTGSADCDFTDLTSSFVRKTCTSTIGGSPTDTRGRILVGNAAADTGSIVVSQCQCDRQGWATSPKVNDTAMGADTPNIDDAESVTWPSDADSGEIETVFYLDHTVPTDDSDNEDSWFLWDVPNAANSDHRIIEWYQQATTFHQFRTTDGVSSANTTTNSQWNVTANMAYVARVRWRSCGVGLVNHYIYFDTCGAVASCEATTLVASDETCTKVAPAGPYGPTNLGRRFNDIFGLNGHIARMTVRELQ